VTVDLPSALTTSMVAIFAASVPLFIFLFTRKSQLRMNNTTSDATQITAAAALVTMLQEQVKALDTRLEKAESDASTDRTRFTEQLTRAHDENSRMAAIIATLHTDLDIAHRQIEELRVTNRMRMNAEASQAAEDAMTEGGELIEDEAPRS